MIEQLENLVRAGSLKAEPPDVSELAGLLRSAQDRLKDAHNPLLSFASRFDLAYNSAHALALYALCQKGYRSDKRYLVFQCLTPSPLVKPRSAFFPSAMSVEIWRSMRAI